MVASRFALMPVDWEISIGAAGSDLSCFTFDILP